MPEQTMTPVGDQYRFAIRNAKEIRDHSDLSPHSKRARYRIDGTEGPRTFNVAGNRRRLFEALRAGPVVSASDVHLADLVRHLRACGLAIETVREVIPSRTAPREKSVYLLKSCVSLVEDA